MSKGEKLPPELQAKMSQLTGADLSAVRVHYNSPEAARTNALSFARGDEIHVAPGQKHLVAHELAHVVQQRSGRVGPNKRSHVGLSVDSDALEVEADMLGARAAAGVKP